MDRLACINLPELPLQLLLRRHPDWRLRPLAVVSDDRPQSPILHVNAAARRAGIVPGMRYAQALSLLPELCAGVVRDTEITAAVTHVRQVLQRYSPGIEPSDAWPGLFWLDASGLGYVYESLKTWGRQVRIALGEGGYRSTMVVGFRRFDTLILAQVRRNLTVLQTATQERAATGQVGVSRLLLDGQELRLLQRVGVETVGEFLALPASGVRQRFAADTWSLYQLAHGNQFAPLQPQALAVPRTCHEALPHGENNSERLLFSCKRMLHALLVAAETDREWVSGLALTLSLEGAPPLVLHVAPAQPTWDARVLLDLLRLRLGALRHGRGVIALDLRAETCPATPEALRLWTQAGAQRREAAGQALARVRAEFGDAAVMVAQPQSGHLPEARMAVEPRTIWPEGRPRPVARKTLVRRLLNKSQPLPEAPFGYPNEGARSGASRLRHWGSYLLAGGWWRQSIRREYHHVDVRHRVDWVYHDTLRQQWYRHGHVE